MPLLRVCYEYGPKLDGLITHDGKPVPGANLLWTIAGLESGHGAKRDYARYEAAYGPGGVYYRQTTMRALYSKYGAAAACSWGSWQIMYVCAKEMGFSGPPWELTDDYAAVVPVVELIYLRIVKLQRAKTLSEVLDSYNSGNFKDRIIPEDYIAKGITFYAQGMPPNGFEPTPA